MRESELLSLLRSIGHDLARIADAVCALPPPCGDAEQTYRRQMAARLLGVSIWTIDQARKRGQLREARRIGQRDVRITGESLLRFQRERTPGRVRVNHI